MKTDIEEAPVEIPKKRRVLEKVPDVWIATWLARDDITPSQRSTLERIRADRRARNRAVRVGLLIGDAGITPEQRTALTDVLDALRPDTITHPGVASNVHQICKRAAADVVHYNESGFRIPLREVVRRSDVVIACPHESTVQPYSKSGVWSAVGSARTRSVPVKIILPNGKVIDKE